MEPTDRLHLSSASWNLEVFKSEYQRTWLISRVVTAVLVLSLLYTGIFPRIIVRAFGSWLPFWGLQAGLCGMLAFEWSVGWRIRWFHHHRRRLPPFFTFGYSLVEVSFPSLFLAYLVGVSGNRQFLDSPLLLFYFLILGLSALHLNGTLCIVTALTGGLQYGVVVFMGFHRPASGSLDYCLPETIYYLRCFFIALCGVASGFVARQIRSRISRYLRVQQTQSTLERAFGQQVSEEIAHTLLEQGDSAWSFEATILALDIRDFTQWAERHTSDEILTFQNLVFSPVIDRIHAHRGIVNQILGDGLMAIFGAPVADPDHACHGYQAALAVYEQVQDMIARRLLPPLRLGIGLHSGEVITGNIGTDYRRQYSFSGTPVIIAFRVEQLNKELGTEFLMTAPVRAQLRDCDRLVSLGWQRLKGITEPLWIYKVLLPPVKHPDPPD